MSLQQDLYTDLSNVFINPMDFATTREFVIADGMGGTKTVDLNVIWDTDVLKKRGAIAQAQGVFFGDVCVFIRQSDLPRVPLAGEYIFSPSNCQYEILESTITDGFLELSLMAVRAHTG